MEIEVLRAIGKNLLREIPLIKKKMKISLGVGASGDTTYQVDRTAEEIVLDGLMKAGESMTVISEELGVKNIEGGGIRVLIDPIDGSRNAISGIPFYCTSIAIADGNTIGAMELAYIVNLVNGDEFWARKGRGAFLNGEMITTQKDEEFYLVAYEAQTPHKDLPYIMPLLAKSRKTRCLGATALDLSYLANGSISIFANPSPSRSFDFAAGWLIVKEAGGIITDIKGNAIEAAEVSLKKTVSLLASGNRQLHEKALRLLGRR
ncbi:MAG: inositol monophosphatase family protein [Nitrospirota bacterium]